MGSLGLCITRPRPCSSLPTSSKISSGTGQASQAQSQFCHQFITSPCPDPSLISPQSS